MASRNQVLPFALALSILAFGARDVDARPQHAQADEVIAKSHAGVQAVRRALGDCDYEKARELVRAALTTLFAERDRIAPKEFAQAAWEIGTVAERTFDLGATRAALTLAEETLAALVPAHDRDLRNLRTQLAMIECQLLDFPSAARRGVDVIDEWCDPAPGEEADFLRAQFTFLSARTDPEGLRLARSGMLAALARTEPILGPLHFDVLTAKHCLAIAHFGLRDIPAALALEEPVHEGFERTLPWDHPYVLYSRGAVGLLLSEGSNLTLARSMLEAELALEEVLMPWDHMVLTWSRMNLALTLDRLGEVPAETVLFEQVLAVREKLLPDDDLNLAWARGNLASCYRVLGMPREALPLEEKVLATRTKVLASDNLDLRNARLNLAITLVLLGDAHRATELLNAVLDTAFSTDAWTLANVLRQSTSLYEQGHLMEARALQQRLLSVFENDADAQPALLAHVRTSFACTLHELGDVIGTRAMTEAALEGVDCLPPEERVLGALIRINLASMTAEMHDLATARMLLTEAVRTCEAQPIALLEPLSIARLSLAQALLELGEVGEARAQLTAALELRASCGVRDELYDSHVRGQLAEAPLREGDLLGAQRLLEEALALNEANLPPGHGDVCSALYSVVRVAWKRDDRAALDALEHRLIDALESGMASATLLPPRTAAARVERMHAAIDAAMSLSTRMDERIFAVVETARALVAGLAEARRSKDPELTKLMSDAADVRRTIQSRALLTSSGDDDSRLARLVLRRDELEGQIRARLAQTDANSARIDARSVSRLLARDERAVSFVVYSRMTSDAAATPRSIRLVPTLAAFVVDAKARVRRVELGSTEDVAAAVHRWRAAIGEPLSSRGRGVSGEAGSTSNEREAAERLRALVLDPVFAVLGDSRELQCCLDDVLHLVPLDALPLGKGLVGDRYRIHLRNSFLSNGGAPFAANAAATNCLVAVGGVDFDADPSAPPEEHAFTASPPVDLANVDSTRSGAAGWSPLPGALRESEFVAECFRHRFGIEPVVLTGPSATKERLESALRGARWVHIATHGWFGVAGASDPSRAGASTTLVPQPDRTDRVSGLAPMTLCGLALAGANRGPDATGRSEGIMTAEEFAGLDLGACELAVLSACETNVGRTTTRLGIQSLQTALHAAGARRAITSLWRVDDEASRALFEDFYARVWTHDEDESSALWNAKRALRDQGRPIRDWAAWVLTEGSN